VNEYQKKIINFLLSQEAKESASYQNFALPKCTITQVRHPNRLLQSLSGPS
jgi:hypothetical protein